jgi:hypothetical protein
VTERTKKAGGDSKGEIKKAEEQPVQQVTPTRALSPFE